MYRVSGGPARGAARSVEYVRVSGLYCFAVVWPRGNADAWHEQMLCGGVVRPLEETCVAPAVPAPCPAGGYPLPGGGCSLCPSSDVCPVGSYQSGCLYGTTQPECSLCPASLLVEPGAAVATGSRQWIKAGDLRANQPFAHPRGALCTGLLGKSVVSLNIVVKQDLGRVWWYAPPTSRSAAASAPRAPRACLRSGTPRRRVGGGPLPKMRIWACLQRRQASRVAPVYAGRAPRRRRAAAWRCAIRLRQLGFGRRSAWCLARRSSACASHA